MPPRRSRASAPATKVSSPRRLSALTPWILDFSHDPIRMPPRPPTLRHAGYEDDFDFTTVFCDVFWDASGEAIRLVGPPLLNLETELEFRFTALPSMQPCAFQVRHKRWVDLVTVPVPPGTTGLIADTSLGRAFLAPQPNLSELFAGRRCIYAMSQDNDIAWIQDWVRYYSRGHGCNGVVLYDNNSTAYDVPRARRRAARDRPGDRGADHPLAVQMGRVRRPPAAVLQHLGFRSTARPRPSSMRGCAVSGRPPASSTPTSTSWPSPATGRACSRSPSSRTPA